MTDGHVSFFAYKECRSLTIPVLRCLETKEMQRVGMSE